MVHNKCISLNNNNLSLELIINRFENIRQWIDNHGIQIFSLIGIVTFLCAGLICLNHTSFDGSILKASLDSSSYEDSMAISWGVLTCSVDYICTVLFKIQAGGLLNENTRAEIVGQVWFLGM